MTDILIAAPVQPRDDVRAGLEDGRIYVVGTRQAELVEQIEIMPETDAVAVIAPGIAAMGLGCRRARRVDAETRAEGEKFDVVAKGDREPGALGPFVLRPLVDRHVVVAAVGGELHGLTAP